MPRSRFAPSTRPVPAGRHRFRPGLVLALFALGLLGLLGACGGGGQASVPVPAAPSITSFTSARATLTSGQGTTLTAVFSNGTGMISQLGGITSGTPVATGNLTASTTYTLTVTNSLGDATTAAVTVALRPIFIPTGPLNAARANHTATLLGNGKVLVAGGSTGSGDPVGLASAEIYDPATGIFTPTGTPMTTPRISHTATLLPDGTVLIAGGAALASAEIYDPATDTFTALAPMAALRRGHTASLLIDAQGRAKVLLAGGYDIGNHGWAVATAEVYDATTRLFTATGSMAVARESHRTAVLADGSVLVTGGNYLASAERYRPELGMFVGVGPMSADRATHSATLLGDGEVLLAGGWDAAVAALATGETYGPVTYSATSATSPMVGPRLMHTATLMADGSVLLVGGEDSSYVVTRNAEIYR